MWQNPIIVLTRVVTNETAKQDIDSSIKKVTAPLEAFTVYTYLV